MHTAGEAASNAQRIELAYSYWFVPLAVIRTAACSLRVEPGSKLGPGHQVRISLYPSPARFGPAEFWVQISSAAGQPIETASVAARRDVAHPDILHVLSEAAREGGGNYHIPKEWTMGDDWIATIEIELHDGTTIERQFDLQVSTDNGS